jgi:hypothetical protein
LEYDIIAFFHTHHPWPHPHLFQLCTTLVAKTAER